MHDKKNLASHFQKKKEVYLDSSNKNLLLCSLLNKSWGFTMDREEVVCRWIQEEQATKEKYKHDF